MKNERWQQVESLYHATLEKDPRERSAFLVHACDGDETLRREVESLLAFDAHAEQFIESPALEVAVKMMADESSKSIAAGDRFNQYRILSQLGAGGMGSLSRRGHEFKTQGRVEVPA